MTLRRSLPPALATYLLAVAIAQANHWLRRPEAVLLFVREGPTALLMRYCIGLLLPAGFFVAFLLVSLGRVRVSSQEGGSRYGLSIWVLLLLVFCHCWVGLHM